MTKYQRQEMLAYMAAHDDDDTPDGAWQAILEDAAEEWGRNNGVDVDGFDAFMDYAKEYGE